MTFARYVFTFFVVCLLATGASGAPVAFVGQGTCYRLQPGAHPRPGSVLLAGLGGRQWVLDPAGGRLQMFENGQPKASIPLPQAVLDERGSGALWSVSVVPDASKKTPVVWLARGDLGAAWCLHGSTWSPEYRLGEVTGPVIAVSADLLAYSTPASVSAAFAVFDTVNERTVRRFGVRRVPAHPLLEPEENLWLLAFRDGPRGRQLVTAGVYFPEVRIYGLREGKLEGGIDLPRSSIERLVRARERALARARFQKGCSQCIDVDLTVFCDALAVSGEATWIHLAGQKELIRADGSRIVPVALDLGRGPVANVTGLIFSPHSLFLGTDTNVERFRAVESLPIFLGTVVGDGGEPVEGASITYNGDDGRSFTASSGSGGSFMLQGLGIALSGRLEVRARGHRPFVRHGEIEALLAAPIVLEALPRICLRVQNSSGDPVVRYTVDLLHPASGASAAGFTRGPETTVEDNDGAVCLQAPWPLPVSVEVRADGYAVTRKQIAEELRETVVELEPEARLRITVRSEEDEAPVEGARVWLTAREESARAVSEDVSSCRTDEHGRCVLRTLPAGLYLLHVRAEGFLDWSREVTLDVAEDAGASQEEIAVLRRGARILAVVEHGKTGQPVNRARVGLRGVGRALPRPFSCETGGDGQCRIVGVPAGVYTVTAVEPSLGARSQKLVIREDDRELSVRLEISDELRVEGTVDGMENYPGLAFQVLAGQSGFRKRVDVDPSGRFVMEGVPAGPVWFYVLDAESGSSYAFVERELDGQDGVCEVEITLDPPIRVWGRVTLAGAPCTSCTVQAESTGAGALPVRTASPTGPDGGYELRLPVSGAYRITARDRFSDGTAGTTIGVRTDTPLDLDIAGGSIRGVVLSDSDGSPIAGASVAALAADQHSLARTRTDDSGAFFLRGLPSEVLQVVAVHGAATTAENVDLGATSEAEVTLYLKNHDGLRLRLMDPAGGTVRLLDAWIGGPGGRSSVVRGVVAGSDGTVELPAFSTEPHTVVLHPPGLARITVSGLQPGGDPVAVMVPLPSSLSVQVASQTPACAIELLDRSGQPLALDLGPPGSRILQGGGANFNALPPGPVTVRVATCDGGVLSGEAVLSPERPARVMLPGPPDG